MSQTPSPWRQEPVALRGAEGLALVREARAAERVLRGSVEQVRALADRRATEVVRVARTVEPYRSLWAGLDDVRSVKDLSELPIIDRSELQAVPFEARLTRPREGLVERSTSGTTGEPLMTARDEEEERLWGALMWRQLRAQGIPPEARRLGIDLERRRERADLEVAGHVL